MTRAALWWERLWPAIWPALGILGVYLAAGLLDLPLALPPWPRLALAVLVLVAMAGVLALRLRRLNAPTAAEIDRRLERRSGLRHTPLATLADQPAAQDADTMALWALHQARMRRQIAGLRVPGPSPGLPGRDRRALRIGLAVGLVACALVAGPALPERLRRALLPPLPAIPAGPVPELRAWMTPPAYTGVAPLFLDPKGGPVAVPVGAKLAVNLTGSTEAPALTLAAASLPFRALGAGSWQADGEIAASGPLVVGHRAGPMAQWQVTAIPDRPPEAAFPELPAAGPPAGQAGRALRLPWQVSDDYGVTALQAELRLVARPEAVAHAIPIPLPGGTPKQARGAAQQDLTAHPWAGLPVRIRLVATDAPGHTGSSAEAELTLPERSFANPVARALVAIRRQLSLTPEARDPAAVALDGLALHPEAFDRNAGVQLNIAAIAALLRRDGGPDPVAEAQARLWALALSLEENATDRTASALEAARQALREAIERQDKAQAPDASPEARDAARTELDRRTQELQDAIARHLQALAEQARRDGTEMPLDPSQPSLDQRALDRMAEAARDAARAGKTDEARERMAELERLLDALQNARPTQNADRANAQKRQRGQQQMSAAQDMVRREGEMLDRTQSGDTARQPARDRAREADQRRQRALRRALGEMMQQFGDLTGQIPAPLEEADAAMRDSAQALADGKDAAAAAAQQRAIAALQKGGQEMGQQMAQQFGLPQPGDGQAGGSDPGDGSGDSAGDGPGDGPGNGQPGGQAYGNGPGGGPPDPNGARGRANGERRDPLGRPLRDGTGGTAEAGDVRVPDQMEQARTRAIQEELRRRGGERTRPQPELDYIDRLLKPF